MSMGWPFWTVASLMGAYVAYVIAVNALDAFLDSRWRS